MPYYLIMENRIKPTVRLRLDEILKAKGWTQRELANQSGISKNGISVMRTATMIRYDTLAALVNATDWPIEKLLEYVPADDPSPNL